VITDKPEMLGELAQPARRRLVRIASERGLGLHAGSAVVEAGSDFVRLASGLEFASDATFWTTGVVAPELPRDSGFATDAKGYLSTNEYLQSVSHRDVFAAGDCATQIGQAHPRAGVFAVRAAPTLAANLRAAMEGRHLSPHVTRSRYLALVSTGSRYAVAIWNGFALEGAWAWRWKDRIDRRFMARYAASA
jgi:selenide, water dikinase